MFKIGKEKKIEMKPTSVAVTHKEVFESLGAKVHSFYCAKRLHWFKKNSFGLVVVEYKEKFVFYMSYPIEWSKKSIQNHLYAKEAIQLFLEPYMKDSKYRLKIVTGVIKIMGSWEENETFIEEELEL